MRYNYVACTCLILDFNLAHAYLTIMGEMRAEVRREYGSFQTGNVAFSLHLVQHTRSLLFVEQPRMRMYVSICNLCRCDASQPIAAYN